MDSVAAGGSGTFVLKSGDTMTGPLTLSGDPTLSGRAANKNYVDAQVAPRALDSAVVHLAGNQTIAGIKSFSSPPTVPTPVAATDAANKAYVDSAAGAGGGSGVGGAFVNAITDCGAVGDGVTDDYAAIQACINNNQSKTILVPKRRPGLNGDAYATQTSASVDYRVSQRLQLKGPSTKLLCANGGETFDQGAGCILQFDSTVTGGLYIDNTCGGCAVVGVGFYGRFPNANTSTTRYPTRTDDGILITGAHVLLDGVAANFWGRHGINVDGTHTIDGGTPDEWDFRKVTAVDNQQDGIYLHGADANQGSCSLCNAFGNDHVGIRDNSNLGNVWIAPHTNSNGEETTVPAAQSISAISRASNAVTLAAPTITPNAGNAFTVAGVTDSSFNGTFLVCGPPTAGCATPTATSFTYQQTAANASGSGGTAGYATLQAISTAFWDGFIGAYASTGGGADTWIQPYAESNQGNGTTCINWQLGTMVLQPNVACGIQNDSTNSPYLSSAAKSYILQSANVLSMQNHIDAP